MAISQQKSSIFNLRISLFGFIMVIMNIAIILCQDEDEERTIKHISILACAALAKKMTEVSSEMKKFEKLVGLFSERINYEPEQTRNFVNLLILNHCFKSITFEAAGSLIKERAETKDIGTSHLKLLKLDSCYDEYINMDNEEKRVLFKELGEIKDHLKGLSDTLGDISKGDYQKLTKEAIKAKEAAGGEDASTSERKKKNKKLDETAEEEPQSSSLIGNIISFFSIAIFGLTQLLAENLYIFLLALVLAVIVSLLGKKRLRKKIKKPAVKKE